MSVFSDQFVEYGHGRITPPGGLSDVELAEKLKRYRRMVTKRFRVAEPGNFTRFLPKGKLWVSPKIDGELWFLIKKKNEVALCSYSGRVMQGVPVVDEAIKHLSRTGDVIIPGELFAVPPEGGRPRVHHVKAAFDNPSAQKSLGFKAFDLLEEDGQDWLASPYDERYLRMEQMLRGGRRVAPVPNEETTADAVGTYYQDWVRSGKFEGIVVRSEVGQIYKVKPIVTLTAVVVAYSETNQGGVDVMRELSVALMRDDGTLHLVGTVGGGFTDQDRTDWRYRLEEMQVEADFRMANREGTLVRFIKPEIVIELNAGDLMHHNLTDEEIRQQVVRYTPGRGYENLGLMPLVSLIHPRFVRERDDLRVDQESIGLDQVWQHVPFAGRHATPHPTELRPSEVVRREVYTKVTKGKTAVRKAVVIATHKADLDAKWPAFVAHFTDFSASRKDPLRTELRVAPTREEIDAAVEAWLAANIKKGWEAGA